MAVLCGHVYFLHLPIAGKDKLVVPAYINTNDRIGFFVINSEQTEFQKNNPAIASHIIALPVAANPRFLTHDSWLVCNEIVGGWTKTEINALSGCYRGPLDGNTVTSVRTIVEGSRLHSEAAKAMILAQWP